MFQVDPNYLYLIALNQNKEYFVLSHVFLQKTLVSVACVGLSKNSDMRNFILFLLRETLISRIRKFPK